MNVTVVRFFTDEAGDWRWQAKAPESGDILADSGQGYSRKADAVVAAERVTGRARIAAGEVRFVFPDQAEGVRFLERLLADL